MIKKYIRIKELRLTMGYTQQQVANKLGVSLTTYRRMEQGVTNVRSRYAIKLVELYNVSLDYLLERTDKPDRF